MEHDRELIRRQTSDDLYKPMAQDPYEPQFPNFYGRQRVVAIAVLVLIGLLSFFGLGALASSPEAHSATLGALDQKKDTVMTLVAGSTGTSTAITLLPGDAGTPIAEKLVDLSSDFLIVIAAIYLEKYLLTIIGFLAFKVVIPASCFLLCGVVFIHDHDRLRLAVVNMVTRVTLLAVALYCVVPVSVFVSSMIESTYESSLQETLNNAKQTAEAIEETAEKTSSKQEDSSNSGGILETLQDLPNTLQKIPDEVGALVEEARVALNNFIEALAVMIVTSCIIPILVLVLFLWLVKSLLGVSVEVPMAMLRPRSFKRPRR